MGVIDEKEKCWGASIYKKNFDLLKNLNFSILGFRSKYYNLASKISTGDKILIYIPRYKKIAGILVATSTVFYDESKIWESNIGYFKQIEREELFPIRVKTRPFIILEEQDWINVPEIITKLSIGQKYKKWGVQFQRGLYKFPCEDLEYILKIMK
ncbi:MAG: hypothetical protein DSY42_07880 [Aquifex sp.]|nr:MAG: hypothetical protein DSY42_07880 [Aquifex sp.]